MNENINPIWKDDLLKRTIKKWGVRSQLEMAQEEATELALAIRKFIRNGNDKAFQDLASEIADVEIMIEQMKIMETALQIAVKEIKIDKLNRLESRLDNKHFED